MSLIVEYMKPMPLLPHLLSHGLLREEQHPVFLNYAQTDPWKAAYHIVGCILYKNDAELRKFIGALRDEQEHREHRELAETLQRALDGEEPSLTHEHSRNISLIIYPHMYELVEGIQPRYLVPYLKQHGLLTTDEAQRIASTAWTTADCNHYIIACLFHCGSRAVQEFIRCLIEERKHVTHHELARKLIDQLHQEHFEELANDLNRELYPGN